VLLFGISEKLLFEIIKIFIRRRLDRHAEKAYAFTAQHSTAQHSTAQHSTAQHSTAQHRL
jgi:hypothetical protein